jgi:hypothetical protein
MRIQALSTIQKTVARETYKLDLHTSSADFTKSVVAKSPEEKEDQVLPLLAQAAILASSRLSSVICGWVYVMHYFGSLPRVKIHMWTSKLGRLC